MVAALTVKGRTLDVTPVSFLLLIAAIFIVAGLVKGVIGMGLPTVAIGLLGLMMSPARAAAILIVPSLISNIWQAAVGGHFRELVARLWPLFIGIAIGTALGALYLPHSNSGGATIGLGVALAIYALLGLLRIEFKVPSRHERSIGFVCGIATGAITVATGVFAIPLVPYVTGLHMDRHKLVQSLGLAFISSTVTLALALQYAGEIHGALLVPSAVALVAVLAGMGLGQWLRGRIKPETFRLCFFIGLLALGAHLALRSLL
ncbi:MAG: sulfite exporter TauE/SafE family protein [Pseudolabrys sp.]|nr:sulfite exporter TauE/SafE family protein [Pseudolabrys sp.]